LTEQDPLFKKYQVADLTKAYNTATTPEEKERIGLQIWSTTNPSLASRLRPGQSGLSNVRCNEW
jgi:Na+-transporting NADH:ubiquinone oxidoreductase subunit NqrF